MLDSGLTLVSIYVLYALLCFSVRGKESGYLLLLGLLLEISVVAVAESFAFSPEDDWVGPNTMPLVCGGLLGICVLVEILKDVGRGLQANASGGDRQFRTVVLSILIVVTYLILLPYLGYFFSTALFLAVLTVSLGSKQWVSIASLVVSWLVFVYLVFGRLLEIPLPESTIF